MTPDEIRKLREMLARHKDCTDWHCCAVDLEPDDDKLEALEEECRRLDAVKGLGVPLPALLDAVEALEELQLRLAEEEPDLWQFCECGAFFCTEDDGCGTVLYDDDDSVETACPKCYANILGGEKKGGE